MNYYSKWKIIWEWEGKHLYFLNKDKNSLVNRLNTPGEATPAEKKEIENIKNDLINLQNKLEKNSNDITKINEEIAENMN